MHIAYHDEWKMIHGKSSGPFGVKYNINIRKGLYSISSAKGKDLLPSASLMKPLHQSFQMSCESDCAPARPRQL